MASPQLEDGYTTIANEILESLSFVSLSPNESRILYCVIRQTYGWHKKEDWISQSQFKEKTGLARQNVWRAIQGLKKKNLVVINPDYKKYPRYCFQKNYEKWKIAPKTRILMFEQIEASKLKREKEKKSHQSRLQDVSEVMYTKETLTKETEKEKKEERTESNPLSFSFKEEPNANPKKKKDPLLHEWLVKEQAAYIKEYGENDIEKVDWLKYIADYYPGPEWKKINQSSPRRHRRQDEANA